MKLSLCNVVLATLMLSVVIGCGGDSDGRLAASGTVTLGGSPLSEGMIVFADDSGESAGVGMIQDGSFELNQSANSPGIKPGTYGVAITSWEQEPGGVDADGEIVEEGKSRIPERYSVAETSGLTATVSPDETDFTFALESE